MSAEDAPRTQTAPAAPQGKAFLAVLLLAAVLGVVVSLAAWGFLELLHQMQVGVFTKLPEQLGYDHGAPLWCSFPVCALAGLLTAAAILRLPGSGGHIPARGLVATPTARALVPPPPEPIQLPGVVLAALATVGLGLVLGPEAPLLALAGGL